MYMKIPEALKKLLEKQQYKFIGENSAVKVCTWAKKSLRDEDFCYKQKFYGIKSHLCCQMSTTVEICPNRCIFCWREVGYTVANDMKKSENPEKLFENAIKAQKKLLSGFGGNIKINRQKVKEALEPMHFAISLTGEPTADKNLQKFVDYLHKKGKTTFVVSNGMFPDRLKKIKPTQLYLSVDAPNEKLFKKICNPQFKDSWKRFLKSLKVMKTKNMETRTALRLTLIKDLNMTDLKGYSKIIKIANPMFVEAKSYMFVGSSMQRLTIKNMPRHEEIRDFTEKLAKLIDYRIADEKKESRVVLLVRKDVKDSEIKIKL